MQPRFIYTLNAIFSSTVIMLMCVSLHEETRSFLFRRVDEYIDSSAWHISNLYPLANVCI